MSATDKPCVIVTRRLTPRVEEALKAKFNAIQNDGDMVWSAAEILALAQQHRPAGLLITLTEPMNAELIAALPDSVRVIATYSVGINHIDIEAAKARGIIVAYASEATTTATADLAMLLILAACRRLHPFESQLRSGQWGSWSAWRDLGTDPGCNILGVLGMGRIGQAVAHRARAFGMTIHYHQRRRLDHAQENGAVYHDTVEGLFRASSVITLHAPSTPQTHKLINRESLSWLAPGSLLVNTARGDLVDDDALIAALKSGHLAGAGLDVFAGEPNFDRRYLDIPNATLLPHIGTSTTESRDRMGFDSIANLEAVFAGQEPPFRVC